MAGWQAPLAAGMAWAWLSHALDAHAVCVYEGREQPGGAG
eukprot:CAMPEP_0202859392 /NCGR_PEP_ID=MMETSP1391-20130828/1527_1 /ASSEMBLY_ACC=CAM_ASM_000867 /TAXON_ID=1034604 /ORGANISM="Chlamydomonas leiostraca, Strain SAG 11-49" /LENGTH=39 /DNA_ID= /DNA_START= /DNA_END= /DNA_ORIENTATION=